MQTIAIIDLHGVCDTDMNLIFSKTNSSFSVTNTQTDPENYRIKKLA